MQATTIGLDMAEPLFFAVGKNSRGWQVWRKRARRAQVLERFTISCSLASTLSSCRTPDHVRGRLRASIQRPGGWEPGFLLAQE